LTKYHQGFLGGLWVTLELTAIIWVVGLLVGTMLGWSAWRFSTWIGRALTVLGFFGASIPVIVILFWAHYPLQVLMGVVIDPFITAAWVLSLINILAVAEIVKNALREFPEQYITAAKVCGLTRGAILRHITLPILLRQITPALLSSQVVILQATLFASMISVEEILRVSQRINATAYKPVEIYTALALFFLLICLPINAAALFLKSRFERNLSER
jgi:polar amino acid transport system permease protein